MKKFAVSRQAYQTSYAVQFRHSAQKKRIFAKDFSFSFKTVTKPKLNIGNITQALIFPASRSPDEFRDLLRE
jgi:hypothetical protein